MSTSIILSSPGQKSEIRKMYDSMMSTAGVATRHIAAGAKAFRSGGESILTGAALGVAHASMPHGLDYEVMDGKATIPVDAALGAIGLIGSVFLADSAPEYCDDARNVGGAAGAVFGFRKAASYTAERRALAGLPVNVGALPVSQHAGESNVGEDPIVRKARQLANR